MLSLLSQCQRPPRPSVAGIWDRCRPDPFTLLLAAIALLGALLTLLRAVNYGVGMEADSIAYVAVARNLAAGHGFLVHEGRPLVLWPPLFPLLLAGPDWLGLDPVAFAGFLNAGAFGLTIFLAGRWLRERLSSRFLTLLGTAAVMLSVPLAHLAATVQSEPIFILFALLSLLQTERFLQKGKVWDLFQAALFTALACLDRYIGVTLIITTVLLLLFRRDTLLNKAWHTAAFSLIAFIPIGLWLWRNFQLTGYLAGFRRESSVSLSENLHLTFGSLTAWAVPGVPSGFWELLPAAALLLAAVAAAISLVCRSVAGDRRRLLTLFTPFALFTLIYLAYLNITASIVQFNPIGDRLLSPLYLPLTIIAVALADGWLGRVPPSAAPPPPTRVGIRQTIGLWFRGKGRNQGQPRPHWTTVLLAALSLWMAYPAVTIATDIYQAINYGTSFHSSREWVGNDLTSYAASQLASQTRRQIHSNEIYALYIHSQVTATQLPIAENELNRLRENIFATGDIYIVWFQQPWSPYSQPIGYSREQLEQSLPDLQPLLQSPDGIIYRLHRDDSMAEIAAAITEAGPPIRSSDWNIYISNDRLIYTKSPCYPEDKEPIFFLHLHPTHPSELPVERQAAGFWNRDFEFPDYGFQSGAECFAARPLPDYNIGKIRTGQYRPEVGHLWEVEFPAKFTPFP